MSVIGIILLVVFVLTALLLIAMVLLQDEQGDGLGGIFGGGSSSAFGSQSGNVLTKFTGTLGALFLLFAFGLAWVNKTPEVDQDALLKKSAEQQLEQPSADWWTVNGGEAESEAE